VAMNVGKMVSELRRMTVAELRRKHAEVFGEPTRSHHKDYLVRRIAWRIQANAEGGLPERARRRTVRNGVAPVRDQPRRGFGMRQTRGGAVEALDRLLGAQFMPLAITGPSARHGRDSLLNGQNSAIQATLLHGLIRSFSVVAAG